MKPDKLFGLLLGLGLLAGCAVAPSTAIEQPLSARPRPPAPAAASDGAIFRAGARPLFEDRKARSVGDTLTVTLNEKNSASLKANKKESHSGSAKGTMNPNIFASHLSTGTNTALFDSTASNKYENKDENTNDGIISGNIVVTVIEVLPNGNLAVSGEKQIGVKNGTDYLRLSGVVNPQNLTPTNTVSSTQVADARIEYKTNEYLDGSQLSSIMARFFLSVLPF